MQSTPFLHPIHPLFRFFFSIYIIVVVPLAQNKDYLEERRQFKAAFHTDFFSFFFRSFSNVFVRVPPPPPPQTPPTQPHRTPISLITQHLSQFS